VRRKCHSVRYAQSVGATLRRSFGSARLQKRSRVSSPAHRRALRANCVATDPTAFVLSRSLASISWQGGVPPYQAPWCRLACASYWQDSVVFVAVVALARYGHRLRRPSGLHRVLLPSVPASQSQAPLVAATASRPSGEGNRLYAKLPTLERSHSRRRFPVASAPYAPPSARPCGCRGTVASVRRCALCGWSVACGQSLCVCPAHPVASPLRGFGPALVCPSAPKGLPQPSARVVGLLQVS